MGPRGGSLSMRGTHVPPSSEYGTHTTQIRQSRPDSGHGFQVKAVQSFSVVPSSLGSGDLVPFFISRRSRILIIEVKNIVPVRFPDD